MKSKTNGNQGQSRWISTRKIASSIMLHLQQSLSWRNWKIKNVAIATSLPVLLYILIFIVLHDERLADQVHLASAINYGIVIPIRKWGPENGIEDEDSNRRIFFHETSGRRDLGLRQTCTIESAAKHNPDRPIQVFMTTNRLDYTSSPWLKVLQNYQNVSIILVDPEEYFANTPLENWYKDGEWRTSMYHIVHLSDYIRMLTLQKGGGMYMDLDFVTLKRLDEKVLWNFFLIETVEMKLLSNAVLHLERGHRLIPEMIDRLVKYYYADEYFWHGPSMVSNIMSKHCSVKRGNPNSNECKDVHLMPHYYFGPIANTNWEVLFNETTPERLAMLNDSYGVHCWSGKSKNEPLDLNSNQLYAVLMREHCPITISRAADFVS